MYEFLVCFRRTCMSFLCVLGVHVLLLPLFLTIFLLYLETVLTVGLWYVLVSHFILSNNKHV